LRPALALASGATGLCYEVLWARMLGAQFGVSIFGAALAVSAFLLGLGAGALLGAPRANACGPARALRRYAVLEFVVALYALALPVLDALGAPAIDALAGRLPWGAWMALQAVVALSLLTLPACAMGASFPFLVRAFPESQARLGQVYGWNCLGASAGALGALALLASFGWSGALFCVCGLGVAIAGAGWLLSRDAQGQLATTARAQACMAPARDSRGPLATLPLLIAYAGVGACALVLEIAWTRLYGIVLLRTEYVLAILLAVFLLGSAFGSFAARWLLRGTWVSWAVPLLACGWPLLGLAVLPSFSVWMQDRQFDSLAGALTAQSIAVLACTFPATAALGAWLPLLGQRIERAGGAAHAPVALYGANCIGSALGATLVVVVGIPWLGTTACIGLAAVLLLALGLTLGASRRTLAMMPLALLAAWLLREFPPPQSMLPAFEHPGTQLARYEDALSLHHVTQAADGQRTLLADLQHLDASSDPAAVRIQANQARLALLLHAAPSSILFLGLGTGTSASGALPYPGTNLTAVEISAGAIAAARTWFAPVNAGVMERLRVVEDDARHFLAAREDRYDVIVGDLFHPDLAGMSALLSVEQFRRARGRLAEHGVFVQWLAINQFDRETLHTVMRSFRSVFPDARIYVDAMHLALVGSAAGASQDAAQAYANLARLDPDTAGRVTGGEGLATWLGRYWGPVPPMPGPVESESAPVIEYRLPRVRYASTDGMQSIFRELLARRPSLEIAREQLGIAKSQAMDFGNAYLASELAMRSWIASLDGDANAASRFTRLAFEANPSDRWVASALADELFDEATQENTLAQPGTLERILRVFPDHVEALRTLWHQAPTQAARAAAFEHLREVAPLDAQVVAHLGLQAHADSRPAMSGQPTRALARTTP